MVVLTMCGCAVLCWWLCGCGVVWVLCAVLHACVIVCVGGCCALWCCAPVRACGGCVLGACVSVWVLWGVYVCLFVCLCVVGMAGWCVGVRVWLRCDGVGLVAVAWCVCVSWLWCLLVRVFLFVCAGLWCVLRCCVDVVGGGGLCGCTCIVWTDGD